MKINNYKHIMFIIYFSLVPFLLFGGEMNIIELVKQAEKDIVDLTVTYDLLKSPAFLTLQENAEHMVDEVLPLLIGQEINITGKRILIFSLQKTVSFEKYKYFLLNLANYYHEEEISELVVQQAFFPNDWNFDVIKNYKDPIIQKALKKCLTKNSMGETFKEDIKETLNGSALRIIRKNAKDLPGIYADGIF
jgi:hypothetical protein